MRCSKMQAAFRSDEIREGVSTVGELASAFDIQIEEGAEEETEELVLVEVCEEHRSSDFQEVSEKDFDYTCRELARERNCF